MRHLVRMALLALPAMALLGPRAAAAQPDCDTLATGPWSGAFEVRVERRWTGPVSVGSDDVADGQWQGTTTVQGRIDVLVSDDDEGAGGVSGSARATWSGSRRGERADGAGLTDMEGGWLTGGAIVLPAGRSVTPGITLEWRGAWWTGTVPRNPLGRGIAVRRPGTATLYGDGPVPSRPAAPLVFRVENVSCGRLSGVADAASFWSHPIGAGVDAETTVETNSFQIARGFAPW